MPLLPELREIRNLRKKLDLTQNDLQRALNIPQATISRIENGRGNPLYSTIKKIFNYLEIEKIKRNKEEMTAETIMTRKIIYIDSKSSIKEAVNLMSKHELSQIPIIENNQNIGSITSKKIQKIITESHDLVNAEVELIKDLPFPEVKKERSLKDVSNILTSFSAVLIKEHDQYIGIITDADFLKIA